MDWGFRFIQLLAWLGLAWDIQTPDRLPVRSGITAFQRALPGRRQTSESRDTTVVQG
jgi:hypothetical protein